MIIYTKHGDTPASIAHDYLGYNDSDYATRIRKRNSDTYAWQMMNGCGVYADNWPIWLPDPAQEMHVDDSDDIVRQLTWGKSYQREQLADAQRAGVDIYDILGIHRLVQHMNKVARETDLPDKLQDFGLLTTGTTFDLSHKRYEVFTKHVKDFNQGIADYLDADEEAKPQMLKGLNEQRKTMRHLFQRQLKQFKLYNKNSIFKHRLSMANEDAMKAWDVHSPFIARDVDIMTNSIGHVGTGFVMLDFGFDVKNVIQDYRSGDPRWTEYMGKTASKFALNVAIGDAAEVAFGLLVEATPVGWIATIIIAAVVAGGMLTADHQIDNGWDWLAKHNIGV